MHYGTVRDAAMYAAIAIFAVVQDKSNPAVMTVCYIVIFLVLLFFLEVARDCRERKKR